MEPEFRERVKKWSILDGYYVPTRYPNGLPGSIPARVYTRDAAQEAVRLAEEAVLFVRDLISEKTKPERRSRRPRGT
jgi:HEPN domain-containing protein